MAVTALLLLVGVVVINNGAVVKGQATNKCPAGWVKTFESCYKFVDSPKSTWSEAQNFCNKLGGYLATQDTMSEVYWLRGYRSYHPVLREDAWIGGYKNDGKWMWKGIMENRNMEVTDWAPNEPSSSPEEDCVELWSDEYGPQSYWYHWNNAPCNVKNSFICEKEL